MKAASDGDSGSRRPLGVANGAHRMDTRARSALLMLPGLGWLTLLMVVPCAIIFHASFFERGVYGGIDL